MEIVDAGKRYIVKQTNGNPLELIFCHKDETGKFVNGVTTEDLLEVLIARQMYFTRDLEHTSAHNLNILSHLQQALHSAKRRNYSKKEKVKNERHQGNTV